MCIIREKLRTWKLKRMTSLNRLLLAVLQIAQVALIVVVVVYAAKDIRKGVSHRVLLGSLVALVVLVAVTPLVTNAAIVEGMKKKTSLVKAATKVGKEDTRRVAAARKETAGKEESKTTGDTNADYYQLYDRLVEGGGRKAINSYIQVQTTDFDNQNASSLIKGDWFTRPQITQERQYVQGFEKWLQNHPNLKVPKKINYNETQAERNWVGGWG